MTDAAHWYSRGYLPHFDQANLLITVTFCLADAIPDEKRKKYERIGRVFGPSARRKAIEACLDRGYGSRWLDDERIATIVQDALLFFHGKRYQLHEWVVMPTHVHSMLERWPGWELKTIMHSWKSYTAHKANRILGLEGQFWQEETFDRYIRDEQHYRNAVEYIRQNPVTAGLVTRPEDWRYGSAFLRARGWTG